VSGDRSAAEELAASVIERFGTGDDVFASEALKEAAGDLATVLDGMKSPGRSTTDEQELNELLKPSEPQSERMLAVLLPVVEYGGPFSLATIPRALRHVARKTSLMAASPRLGVVGTLVLGRLIWSLSAYAISCERLGGLAAAWRATSDPRHEEDIPNPLLADPSLRHADLYGRSADRAFEDYRSWLSEQRLLADRYPLFLAELDVVFAEADVLLALLSASATARDVYSHGLTAHTVHRFRARLAQPHRRGELATLLGVAQDDLDSVLADAYQRLRTDQRHWDSPPAQLFPDAQ
jgi:hypothetical protein